MGIDKVSVERINDQWFAFYDSVRYISVKIRVQSAIIDEETDQSSEASDALLNSEIRNVVQQMHITIDVNLLIILVFWDHHQNE